MQPKQGVAAGTIAAMIAALLLCSTLVWLRLDRTPPSWDDAYYLSRSLDLYDTLSDRGIVGYAARFLKVMDTKPPLIAALPTPIYLAAGRKYHAAPAVNLFFLAVIFASVYAIARQYSGPRAGLIAVTALGTMPIVYGLSHWFLVECGLIAAVCAAVCFMAGWSETSGGPRACALGATFGLGMLMKASFPLYVLLPFLWFCFRWRKTFLRRAPLIAFFASLGILAAPSYLVNARAMLATTLKAGSAETARIYQTGEALSASAIGHYLFDLANAAPWLYLAAIPVLLLIGLSSMRVQPRSGLFLAFLWLAPVIFLAFGHYRDIRYAAPLYPAAALIFAWTAEAAIRSHRAIAIAAIVVTLSVGSLDMLQNSFGVPRKHLALGGLLLNQPRFSYVRPYDPAPWPQREILGDTYRGSNLRGGTKASVLVATNSLRFNADNFILAAVQEKLPFEIGTTAYLTVDGGVTQALNQAAFLVYKQGGEADQPNFNTMGELAIRQARGGGRFTELPISRVLPDGGVAHVLAKTSPATRKSTAGSFVSAGLDQIPSCKVIFAGSLQLEGIGVATTSEGLEVKYRWRCLKPMDRDYWCFTHVVDRRGNVAGYLDHRILNGDPPTSSWKAGDVALERLIFPLPEADAGAYDLRVGVFHRESGERLPITESTFPLVQERTAAFVSGVGRR